jgi:hypothetical protein
MSASRIQMGKMINDACESSSPHDLVITYVRQAKQMTFYNMMEFIPQMMTWKHLGVEINEGNLREVIVGEKKYYLFVVQPKELDTIGVCPLCLAFGFMVSGYGYLTPSEKFALELTKSFGNSTKKEPCEKPKVLTLNPRSIAFIAYA